MTKYFYLFRHGETNHLRDGTRPMPTTSNHTVDRGMSNEGYLTDLGQEQSNELANFLSDKDLDIIFSSPYDRSVDTAKFIAKYYNNLPIILDNDFREGLFYHSEWGDETYEKNKDRIDATYARISNGMNNVLNTDYKHIGISSHGGITRAILKFANIKIDKILPGECFCLIYNGDAWQLTDQFIPKQREKINIDNLEK